MTCKSYIRTPLDFSVDVNQPGLIAAYDMQPSGNELVDISGNGNDGDIVGPNYDYLKGMRFLDDYVDLGDNNNFKISHFTISLWIIPYNISTANVLFSSYGPHWYVGLSSQQRLLFSHYDSGLNQTLDTSPVNTVWPGLLTHVAFSVSVENSTVMKKMYYNGANVGDFTHEDGWSTTYGNQFLIGGFRTNSLLYNGHILSVDIVDHQVADKIPSDDYSRNRSTKFRIADVENTSEITGGEIGSLPFRVSSGGFSGVAPETIRCDTSGSMHLPGGFLSPNYKQNAYGRWHFG